MFFFRHELNSLGMKKNTVDIFFLTTQTFIKKDAEVETLSDVTQGTDTSAIFDIIHSLPETALFQKEQNKKIKRTES